LGVQRRDRQRHLLQALACLTGRDDDLIDLDGVLSGGGARQDGKAGRDRGHGQGMGTMSHCHSLSCPYDLACIFMKTSDSRHNVVVLSINHDASARLTRLVSRERVEMYLD